MGVTLWLLFVAFVWSAECELFSAVRDSSASSSGLLPQKVIIRCGVHISCRATAPMWSSDEPLEGLGFQSFDAAIDTTVRTEEHSALEERGSGPCLEVEGLSRGSRKRRRRKQRLIQQRLEESWGPKREKPRPLGTGDGFEKAPRKEEEHPRPPPPPLPQGTVGGRTPSREERKLPSRDVDKAVESGRRQSGNEDCSKSDTGEQTASIGAVKTAPMPATKFYSSYGDLRNYKIPKIKRSSSEQSGEILCRAEEQCNRSPEKSASAQQSPKPQEGTPEKAVMTARPQILPSTAGSLGRKSPAKGLMDQIIDDMDKSHLKVTHPNSPFHTLSRRESGSADPACPRSPAKRPLVQDSGNTVSRTAPTPPPEKRTSFGVSFPRSWEQPRQLCIVCRRRSVSDSGLRDTCIRCSFSQGFHVQESGVQSVVRDKPAPVASKPLPSRPPEPPPPAKPSSRRDSSDVENRRERIVRPRQDGGVSKHDGSGVETAGSSSSVRKHGCGRRKRAVRKLVKTKAVISSSDESSDEEKDGTGTAPSSLEEKKSASAASFPRKGGRDGGARPADDKREPHFLREKNENSDSSSAAVPRPSQDKKAGSSSTAVKKKQKVTSKDGVKRQRQKCAWKKAKDTADYLKVLGEFQACDPPSYPKNTSHEEAKERAKDGAKDRASEGAKDDADDEEEESVEAVLACLRQTEREKLANTASSREAGPDSDEVVCNSADIVTINQLKQPVSPALVVSSCRSLSIDDWEKMEEEEETETHEDSAVLNRDASIDAGMPDTVVVVVSSDSSSSDTEACSERFSYNFGLGDSSPIEIIDFSSDTSQEANEVSYSEDGTQCVRVREESSSKEERRSSLGDDTVEVTEHNSGEILASTGSMVPAGFVTPVWHRDPVSSNGEGTAKEGLDMQSTVTPLVSVSSTVESANTETLHDVCATTSPVTAATTEESANTETPCEVRDISSVFVSSREEVAANDTPRSDSAVALPCAPSPLTDVLPSEETALPASSPHPNQELACMGDQTLSALSELSITIEGEAGSESSPSSEDRPLLAQKPQQQGLRVTAGSSNASSAEWDPLRAVEELFPLRAINGSFDSPSEMHRLLGIVREYMEHFERFFAAYRSYRPEGQVALVDDLLECGGFAKLWSIIHLLWGFQATSKCISRGRIKDLEDRVCSMLAQGIAHLGPTLTASNLPPYMSFEALPPEPLEQRQQSASPLGIEVGPSQEQVVEVDPGLPDNSMDTSDVQPDAVAAPQVTGRPAEASQTPEAIVAPIVEDVATARQTPQSPAEGGLSETTLAAVVEGTSTAVPTEARRTPVAAAALPAASPRMLEQVEAADATQVAEARESPQRARASTWHPPIVHQVPQANGSRAGLTRVPETDRSPEAAPETSSAGISGVASSKVVPMPTSSNVPARNQILLQVRKTKRIPQARIAPQNPPPPPLQQGRPAAGSRQAGNGTLVRVEIREPPPLQRAPNQPAMSRQQLQELQCQLAAYTYVTSVLNSRMPSGGQQQPSSSTDRPQLRPLNLAQQQPENAASLKRMPPLQYMARGAQPPAAATTRPREVSNQPALLKLQSFQGSPRMPQLLPASSANQPSANAEERSQRPPAYQGPAIQPTEALLPEQWDLQFQLHRRQYYELLFQHEFSRTLGDRQRSLRAFETYLAANAPASQVPPEVTVSSFQHQLRQASSVEQSSSHQSLMRATVPGGDALNSSVEQQGYTAAVTRRAESSLSQRRPPLVRPWCDKSPQQQPQTSQWPYPYAACQEALLRYKQQQRGVEAASSSATPSVAESSSSLSERSSTPGPSSSPMCGSSAQHNQGAPSQPAGVRSSPEQQGCAAKPSDGLQGRSGAPRAVPPGNHAAYLRFLNSTYGSSSLLVSQEGVLVVRTPNVSGPPSEAVAGRRVLPQAPHFAANDRPPETQPPR